jgi:hypothetical protein
MTVGYPQGSGPFTVEDLERMPDDGRRYELLDGVLLVSPVHGTRHQKIVVHRQIADVKGEDAFEAEHPYPVRVVPADLLGTLWRKP